MNRTYRSAPGVTRGLLGNGSIDGTTDGRNARRAGCRRGRSGLPPEPFTVMYKRSLYQSMHGQIRKTLERLRRRLKTLPEAMQEAARRILHGEEEILRLAGRISKR